jgi:hypothetical protein
VTLALFAVAVAAGLRGVWSPCGLSMLSTITPMGERGRGNRYGPTAAWYVLGAAVGGLSLGALVAVPAALAGAGSGPSRALVATIAAVLAAASDLRIGGFRVPFHKRQVNERWLDEYRPWVYGTGFGWQVGSGFATYIMTAANHLLVVLAVLRGSALVAVLAGTTFGVVRGLTVLSTRRATTPDALTRLHRQVHRFGPTARDLVVAVELGAALLVSLDGPRWVSGLVVLVAGAVVVAGRARRSAPACSLDAARLG